MFYSYSELRTLDKVPKPSDADSYSVFLLSPVEVKMKFPVINIAAGYKGREVWLQAFLPSVPHASVPSQRLLRGRN
jgi:hypothetical protein